MDSLRIAVSGSSGLIGRALCERLVASGHAVTSVQRVNPAESAETSGGAILWDPTQGLLNPQRLSGTDCMIHLAGRSIASARWTPSEKQRIRDSRVRATRLLVDQICQLDRPPQTFISASATGIYGEHGAEEVDEVTPRGHDFLADVASDWEDACLPLVHRGVRVVHPRFGMVLSQGGGGLAKMLPLFPLDARRTSRFWQAILELGGIAGCGFRYRVDASRNLGRGRLQRSGPPTYDQRRVHKNAGPTARRTRHPSRSQLGIAFSVG
ncbi:MAG: NAD-dependent epimerase/dehydratase family protein [Planctomycetales bacterium]|nr:NAD-dependent epimerase/dehydratase family protein [Planctomycetales bacterium]